MGAVSIKELAGNGGYLSTHPPPSDAVVNVILIEIFTELRRFSLFRICLQFLY